MLESDRKNKGGVLESEHAGGVGDCEGINHIKGKVGAIDTGTAVDEAGMKGGMVIEREEKKERRDVTIHHASV